ncbi:PorP/SprF family type IX secretion system membrane protein [Pedobacter punctiformis]|uniref:Type IX secretion system membrane protein PorP/SprF n=1 Tax=Pedobacter punctiformis TaxID=3004097 RepID=A0ABT4L858_9SPHI|nr:type IX secretion system membrane protein PorP/SprF [Pedobacter sp. HCMS5-2]MCZ4244103.1 type IX secretion system membrane protein PorP/SprF [Pedobacter sp. HCMS5-2]
MKKRIILFVLMAFSLFAKSQQDAQYSQYMFNGIYINPAYAGYKEQTNIHSFYRNQWTGITGAPKSMSLAVDAIANDGNVGLALQVASDKLGAQSSLSAYANYAYRIKTNSDGSSRLAFGLGLGVIQNGLNGDMLDPLDGGDQYIPVGTEKQVAPDARAGVFFSNNKFYAGFSVDNLIAQYILKNRDLSINFPQPKPHYYLTAGMLVPLSAGIQLKPSFLLKDDRGGPTSLDLNAFVLLADRIWLGGSYRTAVKLYSKDYLQRDLDKKNSIVAMTEIFATPQLRLGYAFDYSLSELQGYSGGSHEISVGFYIKPKKVRMLTPRYF